MALKKIKLSNGARLMTVPLNNTEAITVLALFPVGSRYEKAREAGLSHFLEHMMFKGTERRPSTLQIARELDKVGAEYNAYTSRDHTGYYIKISADQTELALDLLSDMLWHSRFASEEIEREKGVIVEEINMYKDNPTMYIEQLVEEAVFSNHPLGRDIAGAIPTVRSFTKNQILSFYQEFYQPRGLILVIAGKIKKEAEKLAAVYFGQKMKKSPRRRFLSFTFPPVVFSANSFFKKTDQVHSALAFKGFSYDAAQRASLAVLNIVLGATMSSRLFVEVRERRGLAYLINSGLNLYQDTGNLVVRAGLDKEKFEEAMRVIFTELKKIKQGITKEELAMAKENLAGHLVLNLEDSSFQAEWFGRQALLRKKIRTPEEELKRCRQVTEEDIIKAAGQVFNFKRLAAAVIGPFDKKRLKEIVQSSIM
ncbi:MAG: insulinase family protein [Candidatus Magasanikbacteria bacterium]|nr:insulinase family protein [Candidatus Magasanikbacteria bacterium]